MHPTQTVRSTARKRPVRKQDSAAYGLDIDRQQDGLARRQNSLDRENPVVDLKMKPQTVPSEGSQSNPERKRVETVVETLATLRSRGETLAEVAHDARNMVTALGLYCDLLEEPGVLATPFIHYGHELRLVAAASRRLVERIVSIDAQRDRQGAPSVPSKSAALGAVAVESDPGGAFKDVEHTGPAISGTSFFDRCAGRDPSTNVHLSVAHPNRRWDLLPAVPVANLAAELLANRNLLAALAGPAIALTVEAEGGARPVHLTGEDLTRVLVNLVKNATEAMPLGGRIHIALGEEPPAKGTAACLLLTVEDNGPGIPPDALETIFTSGYTKHVRSEGIYGDFALNHRGLGLTISRSIVEGAGGRITAGNREQGGARFALELPLRNGGL